MPNCTPWDIDPDCCDLPDGAEIEDRWVAVASDILWAASGRRYGVCETTVRPCVRACGGGVGLPVPYKGADGAWRNYNACGCNDTCSCTDLSEVILDGPVAHITEVLIDGVTLDADAYRLDTVGGGYRLLRVDGGSWPACQDFTAACDEVGSWCITYGQGIVPDDLGTAAVSEAACELTKACLPNCKTCRLPANVISTVRRGVTVNFEQIKSAVLGLPMAAAFIEAVNPNGLMSKSSVWSPDIGHQRVTPSLEVS